ncbi:unnamed protein product [Ixodes pacificus]
MKAAVLVTVTVCLFYSAAGFFNMKSMFEMSGEVTKCFQNKDMNVLRDRYIKGVPKCSKDMKKVVPCMMTELQFTESDKACIQGSTGNMVKGR